MPETPIAPDSGFVVDWQLADDPDRVIDLSAAESDVLLPDEATISSSVGRS